LQGVGVDQPHTDCLIHYVTQFLTVDGKNRMAAATSANVNRYLLVISFSFFDNAIFEEIPKIILPDSGHFCRVSKIFFHDMSQFDLKKTSSLNVPSTTDNVTSANLEL
jgi:hypothetical protein